MIKSVCKQGLKLHSEKSALRHQCTVLLDQRNRMLQQVRISDHNCLSEKGTDLGSTDIEDITQSCNVFQSDIISLRRKAIAESGAIYEKRDSRIMACAAQIFKFA